MHPFAGPLSMSLLAITILLLGTAHAGEVFRWTDDRGNIHFGDRPPPGEGEILEIKPGATASTPRESAEFAERRSTQQKLLRIYQDERAERAEARKREAAKKQARKQHCTEAKQRLYQYRHAPSLYRLERDGSRKTLSTNERHQATDDAQKEVNHWCR